MGFVLVDDDLELVDGHFALVETRFGLIDGHFALVDGRFGLPEWISDWLMGVSNWLRTASD